MSNQALGSASAPTDDSDLEDLITKGEDGTSSSTKIEKFNLDTIDQPVTSHASLSPLSFLSYTCTLCLSSKFSKCLAILLVIGLLSTLMNPTKKTGIMGADYSAIQSAYDLSLSKVHHWCISGDNDSCLCEDPLEPQPRNEFHSWNSAHKSNVAEVNLYRATYGESPTMIDVDTDRPRPPLDVAFLGESVVEAMDGRWLGKHIIGKNGEGNLDFMSIDKTFDKFFSKQKGAQVEGVALGIAGDTTSNVLWRIQHDEMPYDFNPKVWWIVLGMNDLIRMQCSEEIVVIGILRVVEEIRLRKPDAKIVINSLLPMIHYDKELFPTMADAVDFTDKDSKKGKSREVPATFRVGGKGDDDRRTLRESKRQPPPPPRPGHGERGMPPPEILKRMSKRDRERLQDMYATKGIDLEKAMERRKKHNRKEDKRDEKKVFSDKEKYHPKKPISPLLPIISTHQLPPVWPAVHLINDKLKEFASKHESITFFDATGIFTTDEGGGKHRLHPELISLRGHPTPQGFMAWEGSLMGDLVKILNKFPKPEHKPVETPKPEPKSVDIAGDEQDEGSEHVSEGKTADLPEEEEAPELPGRVKQSPSDDDDEGDADNEGENRTLFNSTSSDDQYENQTSTSTTTATYADDEYGNETSTTNTTATYSDDEY